MFIQTEETPNPATLKFIPDGQIVLENGTAEFKNQKQAATGLPWWFGGQDFVLPAQRARLPAACHG